VEFKHHDAAQDAFACGSVALAAVEATRASHIRELPDKLGMTAGRLTATGYTTCSSPGLKRRPSRDRPALFELGHQFMAGSAERALERGNN
jgi:hypothetical protein